MSIRRIHISKELCFLYTTLHQWTDISWPTFETVSLEVLSLINLSLSRSQLLCIIHPIYRFICISASTSQQSLKLWYWVVNYIIFTLSTGPNLYLHRIFTHLGEKINCCALIYRFVVARINLCCADPIVLISVLQNFLHCRFYWFKKLSNSKILIPSRSYS